MLDWGQILSVVFTGIAVVFMALLILIVVVTIMGKIFESINNSKKNNQPAPEVKKAPVVAAKPAVVQTPAVSEDGLTDEVVAAISAAISCVMASEGEVKPFAIKSIKRVRDSRNAWNMAGITDNTRPF